MIGYIKGRIKLISEDFILVDCNGVGYRVEIGEMALQRREKEKIEFFIYTHVRENELKLFGFETVEDLTLFEMLLNVSGVGPKVALTLISKLGSKQVIESILSKDSHGLKVSGVGVKTANKIIIELADKLEKKGYTVSGKRKFSPMRDEKFIKKLEQVKEALRTLGYSASDIKNVISKAKFPKEITTKSVEELIKYLLLRM
jgi:Holliday junction DNA helicase RuvA